MKTSRMLSRLAGVAALGLGLGLASAAAAQEKVVFLLPAPPVLQAFAPHNIAMAKGYYKAEGLDVEFKVGQGGADVATQVGAGNADVGGGIGDTPVIVRANGVPIKAVAVLGGGALTQIYIREDAGIPSPAELKGKTISVMAYQDTTYYALLGTLAHFGMKKNDVNAQAVGPGGIVQLVVGGQAQALAGPPEWGQAVESAGVKVLSFETRNYYPGMAQAILASDNAIKTKPKVVGGVARAVTKAMTDIMADPEAAAEVYVKALPQYADKKADVVKIMVDYKNKIYAGQAKPGAMDPDKLAKLQEFYLKEGIIRRATPVAELYTNEFLN